jgi:vacuolar-type H+-ATPase subunit F/Vma7
MEIVALGEAEFSLGFEIAGVRSVRAEKGTEEEVAKLMDDAKVGILIVSQRFFDGLAADTRERMLKAIQPISVILSEQESNEELRSMIIKSIGVDLWKNDE